MMLAGRLEKNKIYLHFIQKLTGLSQGCRTSSNTNTCVQYKYKYIYNHILDNKILFLSTHISCYMCIHEMWFNLSKISINSIYCNSNCLLANWKSGEGVIWPVTKTLLCINCFMREQRLGGGTKDGWLMYCIA